MNLFTHRHTHQYTWHFVKEACYGERIRANVWEFESTATIAISKVIRPHLYSYTNDICNLKQEYEKDIAVYEKNGNENDKTKRSDQDYKLSTKRKQEYRITNLALLSMNPELAKIVGEIKDLPMAFDGESLNTSATFKFGSYYPIIETELRITPDVKKNISTISQ